MVIHPGTVRPARVRTYRDLGSPSVSALGLANPGIEIEDPSCVSKTFPSFFEVLEALRGNGDNGMTQVATK